MDKKKALILGGIGAASALGLGYLLSRIIKGSGGSFDNNPTIPGEDDIVSGSIPPGYIYDDATQSYKKVLPESEFKIIQLISGYPTMAVNFEIPIGKAFNAQFALGHWYSSVPSIFTEQVFIPCTNPECAGGRIWKDRYEREAGPDSYTGICPICGGTGKIDVTPIYPLDISAAIGRIYPEYHLTNQTWPMDTSSRNGNYKIGDGVFVAEQCVQEVLNSPWLCVGGLTQSYYSTASDWIREASDPSVFKAVEYDGGIPGSRPVRPNPIPTNYSIIDTLATNIDCGAGFYYDGKKCVPGTHPPNPFKNKKYDVCVVLYEIIGSTLEPRDYMVAANAVTTGDAISEHDGSENKPYLYVEGWQGPGYYQNIPGTSGAAIYVATLDEYNNLF